MRQDLTAQLRESIRSEDSFRYATGYIESFQNGVANLRIGQSGAIISGIPVIGGAPVNGDVVQLIWLGNQPLAFSSRPVQSGTAGATSAHTHAEHYVKSEVDSLLNRKAEVVHVHSSPTINAESGLIAGWSILPTQISTTYSILSSNGFIAFGTTPPTAYGNNIGVWLGFVGNPTDQPRMSLYRDANNYLQWDGQRLLIRAANFTLDSSGNITATNVTLTGTITATAGAIGGFTIGADYIRDVADSFGLASTVTGGDDVRFWAGATFANRATAPFRITEAGAVTATSGVIGNWTLTSTYLVRDTGTAATSSGMAPNDYPFYAGAVYANRATAPFRVTPAGDVYATTGFFLGTVKVGSGNPAIDIDGANKRIRTSTYSSGLQGFTLDGVTGDAEFNNLTLRGMLRTSVISYNAIAATAGTYGVFKSAARLRADVAIPSSPTYGTTTVAIDVDDHDGLSHAASQLFATNDILRLKDGLVGDTWLRVNSSSDQTTFWRYTCAIMAGTNNVTYRRGLGVADYGLSGAGFIIQTADQANSPYLQMATHAATFSSQDAAGTLTITPRLRLGNLTGISDALFGSLTGYGLYAENVYLTGGIRAQSGRIEGVLDIGTSGGIWQGSSGTFSSPTTGFKLYNTGGVGNIEMWSAGNRVYALQGGAITHLAGDGAGNYTQWRNSGNVLLGSMSALSGADGATSGPFVTAYAKEATGTGSIFFTSYNFAQTLFAQVQISSSGVITLNLRNGSLTGAGQQALVVQAQSTATASHLTLAYWDAYTSGTAANGFGLAHEFRAESDNNTVRPMGALQAVWQTAADASRRGQINLGVFDVSSYVEVVRLKTIGLEVNADIFPRLNGAVREVLTAARTYYVRTDGSDSNNGLANTSGGAFLTIQKAIDTVSRRLDLNGQAVTLQVGNGTYTLSSQLTLRPLVGHGQVTLLGDTTTPSNVVLSANSGVSAIYAPYCQEWVIRGFRFNGTSTTANAIVADYGAYVQFGEVEFNTGWSVHVYATHTAAVVASYNYSILSGASWHLLADQMGQILVNNRTVTLTGTPAFTQGFAASSMSSALHSTGCTFSGSATGSRYLAQILSMINVNGGGANYFPGNSAGTPAPATLSASGGYYS